MVSKKDPAPSPISSPPQMQSGDDQARSLDFSHTGPAGGIRSPSPLLAPVGAAAAPLVVTRVTPDGVHCGLFVSLFACLSFDFCFKNKRQYAAHKPKPWMEGRMMRLYTVFFLLSFLSVKISQSPTQSCFSRGD